jgi:hypothetical protein
MEFFLDIIQLMTGSFSGRLGFLSGHGQYHDYRRFELGWRKDHLMISTHGGGTLKSFPDLGFIHYSSLAVHFEINRGG